ncbi:hypothetical protein BB558_004289 [Smittium angustum]|uniref:Uncharacterized protein n=1 Tax=Smittium angustum TaxID=133377 RepID=A0A2U1J080_SMIAN|nr:hypothetical protein BB558_005613 [Smittium angustum]PVZ99667.1 hypothetical protein BB558_004289 [Smittium angustum]
MPRMFPRRFVVIFQVVAFIIICTISLHLLFFNDSTQTPAPKAKAVSNKDEKISKPLAPYKRQNAAMVALTRNTDLFGVRKTMREIEDRFNRKYNYPYIFLNDVPFNDEFKRGVLDMTSANVTFGVVEGEAWGYPEYVDKNKAKEAREKADYINGGSESYRFMCRFQSGYVFRHPLLKDLEYYWRIEPDVHYYCDLDYDPFLFMKENNLIYGFNMAPNEYMKTIPTLWDTTKEFMKKHPGYMAENNLIKWATNKEGEYNGCHFWTNFEIVKLSFYRSKEYMDYFEHLDRAGGFFYERWGDAPVHTLGVAMLLDQKQVHYFGDIGYYHPAMGFCPTDSRKKGKCVCDSDKEKAENYGCIRDWIKMYGDKK